MGKQGVDGVYDADPHRTPSAVKFDHADLRRVPDARPQGRGRTAFSLCRDNNMKMIVFNLAEEGTSPGRAG